MYATAQREYEISTCLMVAVYGQTARGKCVTCERRVNRQNQAWRFAPSLPSDCLRSSPVSAVVDELSSRGALA